MAEIYGDTGGFPDARVSEPPIDAGRLAGLFCQLFRDKFTGTAQIVSGTRSALVGFRDGRPVQIEDSTLGTTLGEQLVDNGTITRAQYAAVIVRMTDGLVDNEDIAFCSHAVDLEYMTATQAHDELSERTRTRLLQLMSWCDCSVSLDASEDSLSAHGEFPQEPGAIVYMGVRTFYDDELLRRYVPEPTRHYVRLVAPATAVADFFALDDDERKLLRALDPQSPLATLIGASIVDPGHTVSVLALLSIARLCEFSSAPFAPPEADRSGTRPAPAGFGSSTSLSYRAMPAVRSRPASQTVMPAVRTRQPSQTVLAQSVAEERPFETRGPAARGPSSTSTPAASAATASKQPAARMPDDEHPATTPAEAGHQAAFAAPLDATQEALLEAAARAARRRAYTPPAQRALREPEAVRPAAGPKPRPQTQPVVTGAPQRAHEPQPSAANDPNVRKEYAKAHLQELMQRRRQALQHPVGAPNRKDPAKVLRQAQDLLREQHYARAEEQLRELIELEPANELYRTYYLWARHRAQPETDEAQIKALVELAKKLTSDSDHGPFACYVLGHMFLALKKDDLAEKYFRRAHAADKNNKDAERHLLIIERRKQLAAEAEAAANRKIFGITIASKPKG